MFFGLRLIENLNGKFRVEEGLAVVGESGLDCAEVGVGGCEFF